LTFYIVLKKGSLKVTQKKFAPFIIFLINLVFSCKSLSKVAYAFFARLRSSFKLGRKWKRCSDETCSVAVYIEKTKKEKETKRKVK
jgi:hypothetical protein